MNYKTIKSPPANDVEYITAPRHPLNGTEFSVNLLRLLNDGASDVRTEVMPIAEITAIEDKIPEKITASILPVKINPQDESTAHAIFYFERQKAK